MTMPRGTGKTEAMIQWLERGEALGKNQLWSRVIVVATEARVNDVRQRIKIRGNFSNHSLFLATYVCSAREIANGRFRTARYIAFAIDELDDVMRVLVGNVEIATLSEA